MKTRKISFVLLAVMLTLNISAQVSKEDYQRAFAIGGKYSGKMKNSAGSRQTWRTQILVFSLRWQRTGV